jgi:hypothetical protein
MNRHLKKLQKKTAYALKHTPLRIVYYEGKPFVCALAGAYFMAQAGLGKYAGLVLFGCGVSILYMRARYRGLIR